jgi:adenosylcobinamide kinase / adenosylcobinamide-phosphate guanylyltransferase
MEETKRVVLLLGGARSGKSHFATQEAQNYSSVLFVATAEAGDEDMRTRIEKHKQDRPAHWRTLEATGRLGVRISAAYQGEDLVIIDCITLLINNILCTVPEAQYETIDEAVLNQQVVGEIEGLTRCIEKTAASFIIVSNEVGLGVVPAFRSGRLYRDLLGRANQMLAQSATEVYLLVAGIPLIVKPQR